MSIRKLITIHNKAVNENRTEVKIPNKFELMEAKSKSKIHGSFFYLLVFGIYINTVFCPSPHLPFYRLIAENLASHCFRQWRLEERKVSRDIQLLTSQP